MTTEDSQTAKDEVDHNKISQIIQSIDYNQIIEADILDLLGATNLSSEDKEAIYQNIGKTIENRVLTRVLEDLSEEDLEEWENIPETDTNGMREFLLAKGIDLAKLFVSEALIYKMEVAFLSKQVKKPN